MKEAITVASSDDKDDEQADFSNFGEVVDIYAPGSDIISAWNTATTPPRRISGTSMADPARRRVPPRSTSAEHPDAKPADVAKALTDGATPDEITNPSEGTANLLLNVNAK